jgi:hypothetical protein
VTYRITFRHCHADRKAAGCERLTSYGWIAIQGVRNVLGDEVTR